MFGWIILNARYPAIWLRQTRHAKVALSAPPLPVTIDSPSPSEEVKKIVAQASERCEAFVTFARGARIELTLMHNGQKIDERAYGGLEQGCRGWLGTPLTRQRNTIAIPE